MKTVQKTLLITSCAMIIAGGCAFNRAPASPPIEPAGEEKSANTQEVVATSTEPLVDMSGWKTYRDEELGFEMSIPPEWKNPTVVSKKDLSSLSNPPFWFSALDVKFWRNQHVDIVFAIDHSTSTLEEYIKKSGVLQEKIVHMNGMELYQYSEKEVIPYNQDEGTVLYSNVNRIVLKYGEKNYLFNVLSFSEDEQEVQRFVKEWKSAFSTFKPIVDMSGWKTYRNEELGFEVQIPESWVKSYEDKNEPKSVSWNLNNGTFRILRVVSTSTFQEVEEYLGVAFDRDQEVVFNGLNGYKRIDPVGIRRLTQDESLTYANQILVRKENKYYLISFSTGSPVDDGDEIYSSISTSEAVIKTFKAF